MCDGVVIDGHLVQLIRDELLQARGSLYSFICWVVDNCGIARTPQIEAHWKTKCSENDVFFWEWYTQQVLRKSVHDITTKKLNQHVLKKIHKDYGLPRNPFVIRYIECACSTNAPRYILAKDLDFYDPKGKSLPTKTQIEIQERRSAPLCRYLEKELRVRVGTPTDAESHFGIYDGSCTSKATTSQSHCPKVLDH